MNVIEKLTSELNLKLWQTEAAVKLLDEGNTVPFIARYRKEVTGSLDDQVLRALSDRLAYLRNMQETAEKIKTSIEEQGALTEELAAAIDAAGTLTELDDLYRPYKKKRKTRASVAREKGLSPLADLIYAQSPDSAEPLELAKEYINEELGVETAEDAYTRLIFPSIEREMRNALTEKASADAIKVFSQNLQQLLMQPPVKDTVTIGLDPGYRTGCKVAVIDGTGKVLDTGVIYPVPPHNKIDEAKKIIKTLVKKHNVRTFAIGNGTASHETECFAAEVIKEIDDGLNYMVVSEAGASVYSASKLAAEEFPQFDVALRSTVSIARRMQDPLAELVKIEPKAIGVGQYQHDMPERELATSLDGVVEYCVNSVGVDLNTASVQLLSRVSGINSAIAKNIVAYREENGVFTDRAQLKKVSKLGPKAYEQCAGFLRIIGGKKALDNTSVHPESYEAATKLLKLCGFSEKDIVERKINGITEQIETRGAESLADELGVGVPTLFDIAKELEKPGRDPRDELPPPMLRQDIMSMEDLKPGMELTGTVRNVIDFGAFVDIGVHQDGLVHISQITNRFIKHPSEVLKVGDIVTVWVLSVEPAKKRISLTMRKDKLSND